MRILFVADVFGAPGRRALEERLAGLRDELGVGFCVVNGENTADGAGLTPKLADRLLAAGADVITLGNHVWRRAEIGPYLERSDRVIRPANMSRGSPGGTAAITDAGMTGPHDSVIGVEAELALRRMRTGMPVRFQPAEGDVRIEGALVECGGGGRALSCEAVRVPVD